MKAEKQAGIVIIILFLIFIVFLAFIFIKNKVSYEYNGFEVQEIKYEEILIYRTQLFINDAKEPSFLTTRYSPNELELFDADEFRKDIVSKDKIYITIDPVQNLSGKTTVALFEINNPIEMFYGISVDGALTQNAGNYTEKTCNDVSDEVGIIWLRKGDRNKIINQEGCIIIEGITEEDLIKGSDRLVFGLLGVIK